MRFRLNHLDNISALDIRDETDYKKKILSII